MEGEVKISKYILRFSLIYLVGLVAIILISGLLNYGGNSGKAGALIVAVMLTLDKFIKDQKRMPEKPEKKKLVWLSFLATYVVSIFLAAIILLTSGQLSSFIELLSIVNPTIMLFAFIFISILYLLALTFFYGFMAKMRYKSLLKNGEI